MTSEANDTAGGALREIRASIGRVAAAAGGSVVRLGGGWRGASGIVIDSGRVLTNAHNVRGGEVRVTFGDGRTEQGRVAGIDLDADLAVVEVETGGASALPWSEGAPDIGSSVFALVATGDGVRVTFGLVSSVARAFRGPRGRRISGSVEHTAPMAPGSSGSPLVDETGRLVGLNTNRVGEGFYLAIPADASLRSRIDALGRGERGERPRLGVGLAPARAARRMREAVGLPERPGALVREVEPGSPAERGGLARGDLIVEAGGSPVADADDLYDALGAVGATGTLELVVVRGTEERSLTATFENGEANRAGSGDAPGGASGTGSDAGRGSGGNPIH